MKLLKASNNPLDDINAVAYEGQPLENRMYKSGYEDYFEMLPVLTDTDNLLPVKVQETHGIMNALANELKRDQWTASLRPLDGKFNRTILAMEKPQAIIYDEHIAFKEGAEIVLARWGDGFSSPVHGHGDGMLFEQLIFGKMRVNTYRIVDHDKRIARPVETKIYTGFENIAAQYTPTQTHKRSALVHNFTSIGYSASLHYVPEHTRDGRDNGFEVQLFDYEHQFAPTQYFTQLNARQGIEQLQIGDVALVRSENVPEYGDHFIVITGKPVLKEHGLRPQDVAIHAPFASRILNAYQSIMGLTLLKLNANLKAAFHEFHGIQVQGGKVIFPNA
jgi:hypothetical protein